MVETLKLGVLETTPGAYGDAPDFWAASASATHCR